MKRLIVWLMAVAIALAGNLGLSTPAHADYIMNSQDAICTPQAALWQNYIYDSDDPNPAKHTLDPQPGSLTQILTCHLGKHFVRINYLTEPQGPGDCEAVDQGYVSAWVDGVKVVNRETFANEGDTCGHSEVHAAVISKIKIDAQLRLTLCHRADNGDGAESCTEARLQLAGKPRNAIYDGPLVTSPDGVDLIMGTASFCTTLPGDPASLELPEEKAAGYTNFDAKDEDQKAFKADIDNDGVLDTVTRRTASFAFHTTVDIVWQSGRTQQSYSVADAINSASIIEELEILRIDDRNYIYLPGMANMACYLEGQCADLSENESVLYRAASDGALDEMCRWRPRGKPEERL